MTASLYDLLGVGKKAKPATIRSAYRKKAKAAHPDVLGGNAEVFASLKKAHDVLMDTKARANYDRTGQIDPQIPDPGRGPAMAMLAQALENVLSECTKANRDPREINIVEACKEYVAHCVDGTNKRMAAIKKRQSQLQALAGRFTAKDADNVLEMIVFGRLSTIEAELAGLESQIKIAAEAGAILKTQRFKVDAAAQIVMVNLNRYGGSTASSTGWG